MKNSFDQILSRFNYSYPPTLIAQKPANPRDSARLLVYDRKTKKITQTTFAHLPEFVPDNSVIVFNQTKVLPARFYGIKNTGGKVALLYLEHSQNGILTLANKNLKLGEKLVCEKDKKIQLSVIGKTEGKYIIKTNTSAKSFLHFLETCGSVPLPPYIKNTPLSAKQQKQQYQTVFSKVTGAVAAPTASLHFTKRLMEKLRKQGVQIEYITLHVGLGTFASLKEENLKTKKLHKENYVIDTATAKRLNEAKKVGKTIIAVGTTVTRTLESASNKKGSLVKLSGQTELFIKENDSLYFTNQIITNFHVPKSSLLMLVSAFTGRKKLMEIYQIAVKKKFRLFSFGDGMYIK